MSERMGGATSERTREIEELIEEEKREAMAYFESRPFAVGRADVGNAAVGRAAGRPVQPQRFSWPVAASVAATVLAILAALVAGPPASRRPRLEVVEVALRGASAPATGAPEIPAAPEIPTASAIPRASGGPGADLAWTVEAALWRAHADVDAVEIERVVASALGAIPSAGAAEPSRRIDSLALQRRIERLRGRSLEPLLRRHWNG